MRRAHFTPRSRADLIDQPHHAAVAVAEPEPIDVDQLLGMDELRATASQIEAAIWTISLPLIAAMAILAHLSEFL